MARRLLRADGLERGNVTHLARQIYDWEKGLHFPRNWAHAYAKAFKIDPSDLFSTGEGQEASSTYEPSPEIEDDEMKRRALLGLIATAAVAAPLGRDTEPLRAALTGTVTTEATDRDADTWERVVHDYAHEAGYLPPEQVLPEILADLAELDLLISRANPGIRPKLVNAAGYLSAFTAISLIGLGDVRGSRRWWRTAVRAGDESGDPLLSSYARGRQAAHSLCDKRSEQAVLHLAEESIALAKGTPSAPLASGLGCRAQALAQMGRHAEAREALDDLKRVFDQLPDRVREDRESQFGWSIQRLHHAASFVYTHTGEHERAHEAQDQALAAYSSKSVLGPAQVEMYRATTLIQQGDTDAGARHVMTILEKLPPAHRKSYLLRSNALTALTKVTPSDSRRPAVKDAYALLATA